VLLLTLFVEHLKGKMEIVFLVMLDTIFKMENVLLFHLMLDSKLQINIVQFGKEQPVNNVLKVLILMLIEYVLQLIHIVLPPVNLDNV
jgi:hypothetical protein